MMYKATTIDKVTDEDEICGSLSMEEAICYAVGLNTNSVGEEHFHFGNKEFYRYSPDRWCVLRIKK